MPTTNAARATSEADRGPADLLRKRPDREAEDVRPQLAQHMDQIRGRGVDRWHSDGPHVIVSMELWDIPAPMIDALLAFGPVPR